MRTQPANQTAFANVQALVPEQVSNELTPDTEVIILFRGGPPVVDKYDSKDYVIPPIPRNERSEHTHTLEEWRRHSHPAAHFRVKYGVALHLRDRNIVPGTRNPHTGKAHSSLAIVHTPNGKGVDPSQRATVFTPEQLQQFGCPEGLDRSMFEDNRKNVQIVSTEVGLASAYARGVDPDALIEAEPIEGATAPTAEQEGLRDVRATEAEAEAHSVQASRTRRGQTRFKDNPE